MELNEIARFTLLLSFTQHNDFAEFMKWPDTIFFLTFITLVWLSVKIGWDCLLCGCTNDKRAKLADSYTELKLIRSIPLHKASTEKEKKLHLFVSSTL